MTSITQAPKWLNKSLYPFKPHYFKSSHGRMHYVDEGRGEVILFVHGTPTWSFLYRAQIQALSRDYRCIAVDHLGFGLSDKPKDFEGSPALHAQNLKELIHALQLKDITLVVHDFGGPIALSVGLEHPHLVKRLVLFNTWLWRTDTDPQAGKINRFVNSWLGRVLYLRTNFSPYLLLKSGFADKKKLSPEIHRHYLRPFRDKNQRHGLLAFAKALVGESNWYQQQWEKMHRLENKPFLILWGRHDSFIDREKLKVWTEKLPQAEVHTLACGHFVQEEISGETTRAINRFMKNNKQ